MKNLIISGEHISWKKITDNNTVFLKTPVHITSCCFFLYSAIFFKLKLNNLSINVTLCLKWYVHYGVKYFLFSNFWWSLFISGNIFSNNFLMFYNSQKSVYFDKCPFNTSGCFQYNCWKGDIYAKSSRRFWSLYA